MHRFILILLSLFFALWSTAQSSFRHDLQFSQLPTKWDEALPMGNGVVGALVWEKNGKLRISLDRTDLWDLRPTRDLDALTFEAVQRHLAANTYSEVQRLGDVPYERDPAPTKIPGAALEFNTPTLGKSTGARLYIQQGISEVIWEDGTRLTSFIHPTEPIGWFRFNRADVTPEIVPPRYADTSNAKEGNSVEGQGLARLGYPQGSVRREATQLTYIQPGWNGFEYQVSVTWRTVGKNMEGTWSITSNYQGNAATTAAQTTNLAINRGFDRDLKSTVEWWNSFWSQSSVSLPDPILEKQWYLEQYKFGCVARSNAPPITLQAVWTADNGNLPPWKGDIHNDLNIQLSYWPAYSGNHLAEAAGMVNWLHQQRPVFERWTKAYFGIDGLNAPGVCTLNGEAMGGWIQYSLSPTTAGWLGHHFYLQWRYTMDRDFLRDKAYPWIRDVAFFFEKLSVKGADGKRKLPLSSSPEFYDNSTQAWFKETTNYDLSIIQWTYRTAAELAKELRLENEAAHWTEQATQWPPLAVDASGSLSLAPGHPYPESHRHFSHLLGIHPLGLLDYNRPKDRAVMEASMKQLEAKGTSAWVGYSFAWQGNIYARMHQGDAAAKVLRTFAQCFCLPNSFHANGDQCGGKNSSYTYRPFTLEGNFAFAAGVQEMLMQSQGGVIQLFPAVPAQWQDVAFEGLRAEGAFVVAARMEKGRLIEAKIKSEKGETLLVEMGKTPLRATNAPFEQAGSQLRITVKAGQTIVLAPTKQ